MKTYAKTTHPITSAEITATDSSSKVQFPDFAQPKKLAKTLTVAIGSIDYDPSKIDHLLLSQLRSSIQAPWGMLLMPVLISELPKPHDEKLYRLRGGATRLTVALELGFTEITAVLLEGTEHQIELLAMDSKMIRRRMNVYQDMQNLAEWYRLLKEAHHEFTAGGNKAAKNASIKSKGLPTLDDQIEAHSGLKRSSFFGKVQIFNNLEPSAVKPYIAKNPDKPLAKKEAWLQRLSKYPQDVQKELPKYLAAVSDPTEAFFQWQREKAAAQAEVLPEDELFPIYHETFEQNAKRIPNGTVDLIATDPNWELANESENGKFWIEHGLPIAPKLTPSTFEIFAQLAAEKLSPNGHLVMLVSQLHWYEYETILRKYLRCRHVMCYLHSSGVGTAARKSGFASHWRPLLVFQRKDAPNMCGKYKQYVHDCVPNPGKLVKAELYHLTNEPGAAELLLERLQSEHTLLEDRMAEIKASGKDLLTSDLIITNAYDAKLIKKFHPWAQDVASWREIIRRFTKPGDFVWEPFAGSGTTAIAAVTCTDRVLGPNGKWTYPLHPRKGTGCDAMERWAKVAKYRVWKAQHEDLQDAEAA